MDTRQICECDLHQNHTPYLSLFIDIFNLIYENQCNQK